MHIDHWVRIGVIGTCLALVPGYWTFIENHTDPAGGKTKLVARNAGDAVSHPVMSVAATLSPVLSGALLLTSVVLAFRRRRPIESSHVAALPAIAISKADWGDQHTRPSVGDILAKMPRNALCFHINPDAFAPYDSSRADPAPGVDKYVEVTYTYPGHAPNTIRRKQGQWLIIPEDPWLLSEIKRIESTETQIQKTQRAEIDALNEQIERARLSANVERNNSREDREEIQTLKRLLAEKQEPAHNPDVAGAVSGLKVGAYGPITDGNNLRMHCEVRIAFGLTNLGPEDVVIDKITVASVCGSRAIRCVSTDLIERQVKIEKEHAYSTVMGAKLEFEDDGSNTIPYPLALIVTDTKNAHHWIFAPRTINLNISMSPGVPSATGAL